MYSPSRSIEIAKGRMMAINLYETPDAEHGGPLLGTLMLDDPEKGYGWLKAP